MKSSFSQAHKWLNVPYDAGIFFCRSLELQTAVFGPSPLSAPPAYLTPLGLSSLDDQGGLSTELLTALAIPSPLNVGIENSRRFRALPIFCALLALGREGYMDLVRRNIEFARKLVDWMSIGQGSRWYEVLNLTYTPTTSEPSPEMIPTVPLNIILFRARSGSSPSIFDPSQPESSPRLVHAINATRKLYVSPAKNAVRIAISNWMTGLTVGGNGVDMDFEIVIEALSSVMCT